MKQKTVLAITLLLCALAPAAILQAQTPKVNVTGLWIMTSPSPTGLEIATLELTQKGSRVEGRLKPSSGNPIPLDNVTVTNNRITFSVTRKEGHSKVQVHYKGTVHAGSMEGTFQQGNQTVQWKARKNLYNGG